MTIAQTDITTPWAAGSGNTETPTDAKYREGLGYQTLIRSNELNGAIGSISKNVQFLQKLGYWFNNITYPIGAVVTCLVKIGTTGNIIQLRQYMALKESKGVQPVDGEATVLNSDLGLVQITKTNSNVVDITGTWKELSQPFTYLACNQEIYDNLPAEFKLLDIFFFVSPNILLSE